MHNTRRHRHGQITACRRLEPFAGANITPSTGTLCKSTGKDQRPFALSVPRYDETEPRVVTPRCCDKFSTNSPVRSDRYQRNPSSELVTWRQAVEDPMSTPSRARGNVAGTPSLPAALATKGLELRRSRACSDSATTLVCECGLPLPSVHHLLCSALVALHMNSG